MTKPPADTSEPYVAELYTAVGRALSAWSFVEEALCVTYTTAIFEKGTDAVGYAQASYWAVESFRAKLNLVDAALQLRCKDLPETLKLWSVVYKRAREKNNNRNDLAHGTVMNLGRDDETYFIPSMSKTMLRSLSTIPDGVPLWIAFGTDRMYPNRLTAAEIGHRTQGFQMFTNRLNKFNDHLHQELAKPLSGRRAWPLGRL